MSKTVSRPGKSSLSDREYVDLPPNEDEIAILQDKMGKVVARYLPIEVIERDLDRWAWTTQNFTYQQYRSLDKYGRPCVSASLELVIPWKDDNGVVTIRKLVGGCNFVIDSYSPNSHFVATAKSECVKNAASDLGAKFGRGLNQDRISNVSEIGSDEKPKLKPDASMMKQYLEAVEKGDQAKIDSITKVYDIKTDVQ